MALGLNTLNLKVATVEKEIEAQKNVNKDILSALDDIKDRLTRISIYVSVAGGLAGIIGFVISNWDKISKLGGS